MNKKNNRKGFTIVELVIVIAVIAILAAVLIPTFAGMVEKANESKALQEAQNAYKEALSKEASAAEIAAGMLAADEVVVGETSKDKDIRTVFYTIGDGYGNTKEKIAVLKKVEGEWKIAEIKDR